MVINLSFFDYFSILPCSNCISKSRVGICVIICIRVFISKSSVGPFVIIYTRVNGNSVKSINSLPATKTSRITTKNNQNNCNYKYYEKKYNGCPGRI